MDVESVTRNYLLFVVLPLWVLVATADYLCHRAAAIERSSGLRETALHFLLLIEARRRPMLCGRSWSQT